MTKGHLSYKNIVLFSLQNILMQIFSEAARSLRARALDFVPDGGDTANNKSIDGNLDD